MTEILSQFEERLSVVKRWGIVRTIQTQSVAEHSFRVALMSMRLAQEYWRWGPMNDWYELSRYALLHDQHEAFTGDLPTPVSRRFDKKDVEGEFFFQINEHPAPPSDVKDIVKTADYMEALIFLYVEQSLGNASVSQIILDVKDNFMSHCFDIYKYEYVETWIKDCEQFGTRAQDPLSRPAPDLPLDEETPF